MESSREQIKMKNREIRKIPCSKYRGQTVYKVVTLHLPSQGKEEITKLNTRLDST